MNISIRIQNLFFAFLQVIGGTGQSITLPMWLAYLKGSAPYFVLLFASIAFVVIFGLVLVFYALFAPKKLSNNSKMEYGVNPFLLTRKLHLMLFVIGFADSMNGFFAVFASPSSRTSLPIQASLAVSLIPITIGVRYVILKKKPTKFQWGAILVVILGVLITMVPTIANFDSSGVNGRGDESTFARIFWPCIFMFGFVPAAVMNVVSESTLKDTKTLNVIVFLFWTSLYQVITDLVFFGADLIPGFGMSKNIHEFNLHLSNGLSDTFHNGSAAGLALLFISFYVISYLGTNMLIRNDEGATWSAVVGNFSNPLCVLFWYLFQEQPFKWLPHFPDYAWYTVCGSLILFVASIVYKKYSKEDGDNYPNATEKNALLYTTYNGQV